MGCVQIFAGVCLGLTGVGISAGIALFKAGVQDIVDSYKVAIGEKAFNLGEYISSKGADLVCQLALSAAISIVSAGKGLVEGAKAWYQNVVDTTKQAWGIGMQLVGLESAVSAGIEYQQKKLVDDASNHLKRELDGYFEKYEGKLIKIFLADHLYLKSKIFDKILKDTMDNAQKESHMISSAVSSFASIVEAASGSSSNSQGADVVGVVALPVQAISQIGNFVDHIGRSCMVACGKLPEYSLKSMLEYRLKGASAEQIEGIISTLRIKGYLMDDAVPELDIAVAHKDVVRNIAPRILEGSFESLNGKVVDILKDICLNFERELAKARVEFDHLKQSVAKSAQTMIYAKIRGEILMPLADKPLGLLATGITEKMQETLALHGKGGLLVELLVDDIERAKTQEKIAKSKQEERQAPEGVGSSVQEKDHGEGNFQNLVAS